MLRHPISHVLLLVAVCFLVITPFFWKGIPSGHDFEFHMFSWMEVLGQWKQGVIYPRWAGLAHWGYGEARFLFYPPASWTLGAALGAILPWKMVPGAYVWLVLSLAGASMYRLAREWLPTWDALFAAVFYAINPYHLVVVYWRSAFAELLAAALLPLLLVATLRLKEPGLPPVLRLSLILAGAWLTNAPAAVMIHYSAGVLAVIVAFTERSWRPLLRAALAVVLAAGLASFYLVPAAYEEKWVNISEVLAPGVRPQDNFLFTRTPDVDHWHFNLLVSTLAAAEIVAAGFALWFSRRWRVQQQRLWFLLCAWTAVATLLMFWPANLLWRYLPQLRFVQLPWRWLLCLNAALAVLLTLAARRWVGRVLTASALLAVVVVAGYHTQLPWWDTASDISEMKDLMTDGAGYKGTDEYVPAGADPYELNKDLPLIVDQSGAGKTTDVLEWGLVEKHFVVRTKAVELVTLRLFNYPAWEVTVNGQRVPTRTTDVTHQMAILLTPGSNDVRIHFGRTRDRTVGDIVSIICVGFVVVVWITTRPQPQPR